MKTIHIHIVEHPIEFMRKLYRALLQEDKTFHFVNWSNFTWQGYHMKDNNILLRVDEAQIEPIKEYLSVYYGADFEIYDYPFPKRRGHLNRFGLGKKSIEAKHPEIFHQIYHCYSKMSMEINKPEERQEALNQLLHIPLNVFHMTFLQEANLYQSLAMHKIALLIEASQKK